MRSKQKMAVVRPANGRLVMETLHFADEVRVADDITEMDHLAGAPAPTDKELAMAEQLLESLTTDWDPERYEDTYRVRVLELIESKAEGRAIVTDKEETSARSSTSWRRSRPA